MSRSLNGSRARDGKAEEPLRFGPEREPQEDVSKRSRPNWKKAFTRKIWKSDGAEAECQGDAPPLPEQEEPAAPQEVEDPRGPDHPDPHDGPTSCLRFDKVPDTAKPEPNKAAAPKGSRPAGRGPSPSQEAGAGMGQRGSVDKVPHNHGLTE